MASVALIGPDGAGKTTITRMLLDARPREFKYVYMGIDGPGSNVALVTTRIVERLKRRAARPATPQQTTDPGQRPPRAKGVVWTSARLVNRLMDEWYRQALSWLYEARGFTVVYDRHFAFDFSREVSDASADSLDRRIHRWCLERLYPRPDLVIFLDAPGSVLYARKGELTVEELERRRHGFLELGRRFDNFLVIDATRPLPAVYREVWTHVTALQERRHVHARKEGTVA